MSCLMTVATVEGHIQIIEFLGNDHTIAVNLNFRKKPMGNIQLNQHFSSALIKSSVEIFIQGNKHAYGIGNTNENVFGLEGKW